MKTFDIEPIDVTKFKADQAVQLIVAVYSSDCGIQMRYVVGKLNEILFDVYRDDLIKLDLYDSNDDEVTITIDNIVEFWPELLSELSNCIVRDIPEITVSELVLPI